MSSAELTVWARVEGLGRRAVQRALWEDRTLVKTWAMRGTLHLLPAAELPMWHAALGTSRRYLKPAAWKKYFGITLEDLDRLTEAIAAALDGRVVTREELVQEVRRVTGSAAFSEKFAANSWGTMLKPAAFTGRLCFGPNLGQRVRFTRPDCWLAVTPKPANAKEATAAIARRYLTAYGPATYHDLASWWNGSGVTIVRQWIATLGEEVVRVDLDGSEAWMLASDAGDVRKLPPVRSVRLLRSVCGRRVLPRRSSAAGRFAQPRLPPAGLDFAGAAGQRPHGGNVAP
jgi:hypothetical protein